MRTLDDLRDTQREALAFMNTTTRGHLWIDVGMGKTAVGLTWLWDRFRRGQAMRALVLATKAIAQDTWPSEAAQWEHLAQLSKQMRVLTGLSSDRRAHAMCFERNTRIDILNYDNLPWLAKLLTHFKLSIADMYDVVICDEVMKLKNPSGVWLRIAAQHFFHAKYFWGLTGSPASEGYHQLWAPVYLIDYGARLYTSVTAFRQQYFIPTPTGYTPRDRAKKEIHQKLADVVMVQGEDLLDAGLMPELVETTVPVELSDKARDVYTVMENELYVRLSKDEHLIAPNAGVALGKCQQILGGAVYLSDENDEPTRDWKAIDTGKLDALGQLIEEMQGNPLLVMYWFDHEKARIAERFDVELLTSSNIREMSPRWNAGEIPVMMAHPQSCGHGLNLQLGPGHHIAWYTLPWSRDLYEQPVGRLRRPGQQSSTVVSHILAVNDSIDQLIIERQQSKNNTQLNLKRAMMKLFADRGDT